MPTRPSGALKRAFLRFGLPRKNPARDQGFWPVGANKGRNRLRHVSIDSFRELVGVPPGQYDRVDNLMSKVVNPAVLQVNGPSDMSVMIEGRRKHARTAVDRFDIAWWRKSPKELAEVGRERNRSKVGRMARLKGAVETTTPRMDALA